MDCKITSIEPARTRRGFVLSEAIIAVGVASILMLAVCSFTMFAGRSFAALFNYVDLNDANRVVMDQLSRDIRQAARLDAFTTNSLTLIDESGAQLVYDYIPSQRVLKRTDSSGIPKTVLKSCDNLRFDVCQRNPKAGSYDVYPAATPETAKVIDVSWVCSRTVFGRKENTESVQTARIVIRKQGS